MSRTFAAMLAALAVPALMPAQNPAPTAAAPHELLLLLLRDPSGGVVADAVGYLRCRAEHELPALSGLPPQATPGALPTTTLWRGNSGSRGELRFEPPPVAATRPVRASAGSGLCFTEPGLGTLVVDLLPDRPQRLALQPMAAVTTATGSEVFTLFARALLPGDRSVTLEPLTGTAVRLPAGTYEVWVHSADGWIWQQLTLQSGQRELLHFEGEAQRLHRRGDASLTPEHRPDVELFAGDDETVLRGAARTAPLIAVVDGDVVGPRALPATATTDALAWPPPRDDIDGVHWRLPAGTPTTALAVHCLRRLDNGSWQRLATCPVRAAAGGPEIVVPPLPPGDVWLLALAPGFAPTACSWQPTTTTFPFHFEPGISLQVEASDEHGLPVVDLAVDYTPDDMDPAAVAGHSDARGTVRLGPVLGPGTLRINDERFANQAVRLALVPGDGLRVTVTTGSTLRGRVQWADGKPAGAVTVTLRDPRGRLRPAVRSMLSGDDGSFAFAGLPDDTPLVLFATTPRGSHTWSARRAYLRAGGDDVTLGLRDEDPRLDHDK